MDPGPWLDVGRMLPAGLLLTLWIAVVGALIARYGKPNLQYRQLNPAAGDDPTVRFLIRSFEPDNLNGRIRLRLKADAPLDSVEVVAGAWLDEVKYDDAERKVVLVTLNGFPAEGVIGLRVSPDPGTCSLDAPRPAKAEAADGWIEPRNLEPIETPYRWLRSYLFRILACAAFGAVMYVFGCAVLSWFVPELFTMPPGGVDLILLGALVPLVLAVTALAVPRQGKDTFPGAIDWELSVRPTG